MIGDIFKYLASWLYLAFSFILQAVAALLGKLTVLATKLLTEVIVYNDFIHFETVNIGWVLVRDVANMFFVVVLLAIAIATILRVETYNLKRLLPKLLLMAILVNFSKTIAGLLIDAAQVVTLTFANAVVAVTAGNLYVKFGIGELFAMSQLAFQEGASADAAQLFNLFLSLALATLLIGIALLVIGAYLVVFLLRVVALWILVILSPLAYVLAAFPQGERYSREWWATFSKYVIVGPILMFFFWLAIATTDTAMKNLFSGFAGSLDTGTIDVGGDYEALRVGLTRAGEYRNILRFVIMTCLMLGGLVAAQRAGVAGSQFAGSILGSMRSTGMGALRRGLRIGTAPLRAARYLAGEGAGALGRVINRRILEKKGLRWMTPSFWQGMKKASQEKLERQRRIAAKFGEEFGERFVQERILGREGSVRNIGQEAERREVVEIKSQIQKDLSQAGFSKERLAYWARITLAAGGKQGENMRQAFAELGGGKGNWDDVYEMNVRDNYARLGMTQAESLRENDQNMKKFMKGFLWQGNIAQANKYDPEEIYQQQNAGNAYLTGLHTKFKDKGLKAFTGTEREDYKKAMMKAREQADTNASKASAKDQMRLLSLANFSEEVQDTGHYEQVWGRTSEKTGQGRFRDELEQIEEVLGQAGKVGARALMQRLPTHVTRGKTYNPASGDYEVDVEFEKMTPFHRAMADDTGLIKPQSAGELGHAQGRKIDRDIGPYFDDKGDLIDNDPEAIKRGFLNKEHLQEQYVMWRAQSKVIYDTEWQRKYTGAQSAKEGTLYAFSREAPTTLPTGWSALGWDTSKHSGRLAAAAEARLTATGWSPTNPVSYRPLMAEEVDPVKQAATQEKINEIRVADGLTEEAAREKYDRVYEKEIHAGTLYAGSEIVRQQKVEQAKAGLLAEDLDTLRGAASVERRKLEKYSAEELEKNPHLASASVGVNFLDPEVVQRYNIDPENAERILALNYDDTTEKKRTEKKALVNQLVEDYANQLQRQAEDFDRQIAAKKFSKTAENVTTAELGQLTDDDRRNWYQQERYEKLGGAAPDRQYANRVVAQWAKDEFEAGNKEGKVIAERNAKGEMVYRYRDAATVQHQQGEALRQMYQQESQQEGQASIAQRAQEFHQKLTNAKTIALHNNAAFGNVLTARRHEVGHTLTAQLSPAQQRAFRDKLIPEQQQRYDQMGAEEYFARALGENSGGYALDRSPEAKKFLDKLEVEDPLTGKKRTGVRYRGSPKYPMPELEAEAISAERRQQIIQERRDRPEGQAEVLVGQALGEFSRRDTEIAAATKERDKRAAALWDQQWELQGLERQLANPVVAAEELLKQKVDHELRRQEAVTSVQSSRETLDNLLDKRFELVGSRDKRIKDMQPGELGGVIGQHYQLRDEAEHAGDQAESEQQRRLAAAAESDLAGLDERIAQQRRQVQERQRAVEQLKSPVQPEKLWQLLSHMTAGQLEEFKTKTQASMQQQRQQGAGEVATTVQQFVTRQLAVGQAQREHHRQLADQHQTVVAREEDGLKSSKEELDDLLNKRFKLVGSRDKRIKDMQPGELGGVIGEHYRLRAEARRSGNREEEESRRRKAAAAESDLAGLDERIAQQRRQVQERQRTVEQLKSSAPKLDQPEVLQEISAQAKRQQRAVGAGQRALGNMEQYVNQLQGRQNFNAFNQKMRKLIAGVSVQELPNFMEQMKPAFAEFRKRLPANSPMVDEMERMVKSQVDDEVKGRHKLFEVTGQYRAPASKTEANVQEVSTRQAATALKRRQRSNQASGEVKHWQGVVEDTQRRIDALDWKREQAVEEERRHHRDADVLAGKGQYTEAEEANQRANQAKGQAADFQRQIDDLKVGPFKEALLTLDRAKVRERMVVDEATQATKKLVDEFHAAARQLKTEEETLTHRARADRDVEDFNALAEKYYQTGSTEKGDEARERSLLAERWRGALDVRQQELQIQAAPQRAREALKAAESDYFLMRSVTAPNKITTYEQQVKNLTQEQEHAGGQIQLLEAEAAEAEKSGNNKKYQNAQVKIAAQREKLTSVESQLRTAQVNLDSWRAQVEETRQAVEFAQQKLREALAAQAVGVPAKPSTAGRKAPVARQTKERPPSEEGGKAAAGETAKFSGRGGPGAHRQARGTMRPAQPTAPAWEGNVHERLEEAYQGINDQAATAPKLPQFDSHAFSQWLHTTESTLHGIEDAIRGLDARFKAEGKDTPAVLADASQKLQESLRGAFTQINQAWGSQAKPETYDQGDEMEHELKQVNWHLEQVAENLGKPQEDLGKFPDEMRPSDLA